MSCEAKATNPLLSINHFRFETFRPWVPEELSVRQPLVTFPVRGKNKYSSHSNMMFVLVCCIKQENV